MPLTRYVCFFSLFLTAVPAFAASGFRWFQAIEQQYHISDHVLTMGFVALLLTIMGIAYRAKVKQATKPVIPDKGVSYRNLFEAYGNFMFNTAANVMGEKRAFQYFSLYSGVFLFIFVSNLLGLIPGFLPSTEEFNTTFALGVFVFLYYNWQGIKVQGFWGHIKHLMGPIWYMAFIIFPIEVFSHLVRPLILGLRLKGNMVGDHTILSVFSELAPILVPIPFYILGMFVSFMQAFVFTMLTMVYIGMATEHHDHDAAHA